ncbi:hypothetical protein [Microbacterium sp. NPDC055521]
MSVKRPRRHRYDSEPAYLLACLRYLDAKYPGREGQRQRVAAWQRWHDEPDLDALRERIVALIDNDNPTPADDAEFDRLVAAWKARRRMIHPTPDTTERNNS